MFHRIFEPLYAGMMSGGLFVTGWVAQANVYLQAISFIISIIVGLLGIYSYIQRKRKK